MRRRVFSRLFWNSLRGWGGRGIIKGFMGVQDDKGLVL
jgi:hypothetical protein